MVTDEEILKALRSAITYLDNSLVVAGKKDEDLLENSVWHVAAELEYTLFLFSVIVQDEIERSKWKLNPKLKKIDVYPALLKVQDLLNRAEKSAGNKLLDAYENTYKARNYVLKIQKDFAKKKREAFREKE